MSKSILLTILLAIIMIFASTYCKCIDQYVDNEYPLINILTRTSNREKCFNILYNSFKKQTYQNKKILISTDVISNYLTDLNNVFLQLNADKSIPCFYNLYLNNLWNEVDDGWIMFIDDDAKFIKDDYIEKVANKCKTLDTNTLLIISNMYGPNKSILPRRLTKGNNDMCNICVHHSCKYRFPPHCGGDWFLIEQILNDKTYKIEYMKDNIGIWANYMKKSNGKQIICE